MEKKIVKFNTFGPFIREKISRGLLWPRLPGQDQQRLKKAVNVDFVPFIRGVRGLHIFSRINGMQIWQ